MLNYMLSLQKTHEKVSTDDDVPYPVQEENPCHQK